MIVYITKYWESMGIFEHEVDTFVEGGGNSEKYVRTKGKTRYDSHFLVMGRDAFKTMDEALEKVEKAALAKVKKAEEKIKFYRAVALDGRKCFKK